MSRIEKLERGFVWCMVWSGTCFRHKGREEARSWPVCGGQAVSARLVSSRARYLEVEVEQLRDDAERVAVHCPRHLSVAEQLDEVGLFTAQEVKRRRSHTHRTWSSGARVSAYGVVPRGCVVDESRDLPLRWRFGAHETRRAMSKRV